MATAYHPNWGIQRQPTDPHWLNAADAERSTARVADIERGLGGEDAWFWTDQAQRRIDALADDEPVFGLLPHERAELAQLKALMAKWKAQ